jgi:peptidoglycan-N-acetylglucosamine deacetylase
MPFNRNKILVLFIFLSALSCQKQVSSNVRNIGNKIASQNLAIVSNAKAVNSKISSVQTKTVYLTFDADMTEGMRARLLNGSVQSWYDPQIIKYLQSNNIAASIFSTGMFAEVYSKLIKELGADPNFSIENHSYDHPGFESPCYGMNIISTDQQKSDQVARTQQILNFISGQTPKYFRFPGLCHNQHDDQLISMFGLSSVDAPANLLISDDAFNPSPQRIIQNILNHAKNGSIILMHLGGPNAPETFSALKIVVPQLQKQGFGFAKL